VGTIFRIQPDGSGYEILHRFSTDYPSPQEPWAALTPGPDGALFGATSLGGLGSSGALFRLNVGSATPLVLAMHVQGPTVESIWPDSAKGYELQYNADLSKPDGWQPVPGAASLTNGSYHFPLSTTGPANFYRLAKP
jgi:uncharacterized repeat protein (TIGR03803 family)